jgi:hypothetical protein
MGAGGMGGRWGEDYTPGWSMMSQQEREEHQSRMRSMMSYDECKAYMQQHQQQQSQRAQQQGRAAPAQPRSDACEGLRR